MGVSYEVYAYKNGNWNIDSVYDDRDMAMHEARMLLESRYVSGAQVIEEKYDDETGDTFSKIIFKERKGAEKRKAAPRQKPQAKVAPAKAKPPPKKKEEKEFVRYMVILVLSVGGIALGLIVGLAFLIESLG